MKEKNFICVGCKRKLSLWDILKLGNGFECAKIYKCPCGTETYFKDNMFLRVFPAIFAASMFFLLNKNLSDLVIFFFIICFLLFSYYFNIKRVKNSKIEK